KGEWWMTGTNNWNAVCLAGVTSALGMIDDRKERAGFAAAAEYYSRNFISGFQDDGYCVEGGGYWAYGFGNFIQLRERLWQATDGKLDLFNSPKIRDIALYGLRIQMNDHLVPPLQGFIAAYTSDPADALKTLLPQINQMSQQTGGDTFEIDNLKTLPQEVRPYIDGGKAA